MVAGDVVGLVVDGSVVTLTADKTWLVQ